MAIEDEFRDGYVQATAAQQASRNGKVPFVGTGAFYCPEKRQ